MRSNSEMDISVLGVVLAGGKASRMNYVAKGLTHFNGEPLISYALNALNQVTAHVMINANHDIESYQALEKFVFQDVPDCLDKGPLSGVYAALLQAQKTGATHLIISPCDTPLVTAYVFELLKQKATQTPGTAFYIESESGIQPLHAIMPVEGMAEKLKYYLEEKARVMLFYREIEAKPVFWQQEKDFLNINYLEQLA